MAPATQVIVVDEPSLPRSMLLKALETWGFEGIAADDEKAAWGALADAASQTILIANWHAVCFDCAPFFQKIRRKSPRLEVYLLSAIPRGATGVIRHCIEAGANDFVSRPYDLDEIRLRLHIASSLLRRPLPRLIFSV